MKCLMTQGDSKMMMADSGMSHTNPLTAKGKKIMSQMQKNYGIKKAKKVFYASANAKRITGVHK